MELREALGFKPGEMVALVGAGGKTTLAWHLAARLSACQQPVVFTTTTHIFQPQDAPLVLGIHPDPAEIQRMLSRSPLLFVAAATGGVGDPHLAAHSAYPARRVKLVGLDPRVLGDLMQRLPGVTWLVEADGARGRLLKAPAAHEPVIPDAAGYVIVVASLEAIGRPLDEGTVHRPELATRLLGAASGTNLAPEHLAGLITHPAGGLKGVPDHAEVFVVLTQWQDSPRPEAACVAWRLLAECRIDRVLWVSLAAPLCVRQVWTP